MQPILLHILLPISAKYGSARGPVRWYCQPSRQLLGDHHNVAPFLGPSLKLHASCYCARYKIHTSEAPFCDKGRVAFAR